SYEQIGGAACYCGITAKKLKFDVELHTKFGSDFPTKFLTDKKLIFKNALADKPTTRFTIKILNSDRKLILNNTCDAIEYSDANADGIIVSPVFQELSTETFEKLKKDSKIIFLDPQGFLRRIDSENNIHLEKTDINLSNVSSVKVNPDEIFNLTGLTGIDAMKNLQKKGVENVIVPNKQDISLLVKDRIYSIKLPNLKLYDTTGIGDIFSSSFCCTLLKEKDFFWALCFAGGAAQAALESRELGLKKVPEKGAIETNAAYFYNQIKFKQV
ncbi:MAG: PfkB family carbohydrate kinase, partial [Nitrosopumilaceae archaeon]